MRGVFNSTKFKETPNTENINKVDRLWARRSRVERETALIVR